VGESQNAGLPDLGGWHKGLVPVLQVLVQGLGFGIKNEYDAPGVLHDRRPATLVAGVPTGVPELHIGPRGPTVSDIGAGGGGAVEVQAVGLVFHNAEGDRWLVIT